MVVVAQLVRAPDCGSGGRRFETGLSPHPGSLEKFFEAFFMRIDRNKKKAHQLLMSFVG